MFIFLLSATHRKGKITFPIACFLEHTKLFTLVRMHIKYYRQEGYISYNN